MIGKRVILAATQEPRVNPRLLAGSRLLAGLDVGPRQILPSNSRKRRIWICP